MSAGRLPSVQLRQEPRTEAEEDSLGSGEGQLAVYTDLGQPAEPSATVTVTNREST